MKIAVLTALFCASILVSHAQLNIPYAINSFMTPEDKLYALTKVWLEVKNNKTLFDQVEEKVWDSTYRAMIPSVMESKSDNECYRLLSRYCAMLKDGCTFVKYEYDPTVTTYFNKFQVVVEPVEGRALVSHMSSKMSNIIPFGSEIIGVNGKPTAEYIQQLVMPSISSSTDHYLQDKSIINLFRSYRYDPYDITFLTPAGIEIRTHVVHDFLPEIKYDSLIPAVKEQKSVDIKWYEYDIAYVAINSFDDQQVVEDFEAIFPEINKRAKKMIIDIRKNGGGNTGYAAQVLSRFTPDNVLAGGVTNFTFGADREQLVAPTVILTGHQTSSEAEDFLVFSDNQKHITLIGEPTAGNTCKSIKFDLPRGGSLSVGSNKDIDPDRIRVAGTGIQPDIESHQTIRDFRKGVDTILETALNFLNKTELLTNKERI